MKSLLIPAALLCFTAVATAQTPPTFEQLDANGDGKLAPEETTGLLPVDFGTADANGDGILDANEYHMALNPAPAGQDSPG